MIKLYLNSLFQTVNKFRKFRLQEGSCMAEREGFEPSIGVKAYTPLAGERLQPLGHLSEEGILYCNYIERVF